MSSNSQFTSFEGSSPNVNEKYQNFLPARTRVDNVGSPIGERMTGIGGKGNMMKSSARFEGLLDLREGNLGKKQRILKKMQSLLDGSNFKSKKLKLPHEVDMAKFLKRKNLTDKESYTVKSRVFNDTNSSSSRIKSNKQIKKSSSTSKFKPQTLESDIPSINLHLNSPFSPNSQLLNIPQSSFDLFKTISSNPSKFPRFLSSAKDLSQSISPSHKLSKSHHYLSILKYQTLVANCDKAISKSHRRRSARFKTQTSKSAKSIQASLREPEAKFNKKYISDAIKEFKDSKLAFVYGKEFQGRYISS
jgi:hypothetical protein